MGPDSGWRLVGCWCQSWWTQSQCDLRDIRSGSESVAPLADDHGILCSGPVRRRGSRLATDRLVSDLHWYSTLVIISHWTTFVEVGFPSTLFELVTHWSTLKHVQFETNHCVLVSGVLGTGNSRECSQVITWKRLAVTKSLSTRFGTSLLPQFAGLLISWQTLWAPRTNNQ